MLKSLWISLYSSIYYIPQFFFHTHINFILKIMFEACTTSVTKLFTHHLPNTEELMNLRMEQEHPAPVWSLDMGLELKAVPVCLNWTITKLYHLKVGAELCVVILVIQFVELWISSKKQIALLNHYAGEKEGHPQKTSWRSGMLQNQNMKILFLYLDKGLREHEIWDIMQSEKSWDLKYLIWDIMRSDRSWDLRDHEIWEIMRSERSWDLIDH